VRGPRVRGPRANAYSFSSFSPHFCSTLRRFSLSEGVSISFSTVKSSATRANFLTLSNWRNSALSRTISSSIFLRTRSVLSKSSYEPERPSSAANLVMTSFSGTTSATLYGLFCP
jgi:hypothetical protein